MCVHNCNKNKFIAFFLSKKFHSSEDGIPPILLQDPQKPGFGFMGDGSQIFRQFARTGRIPQEFGHWTKVLSNSVQQGNINPSRPSVLLKRRLAKILILK